MELREIYRSCKWRRNSYIWNLRWMHARNAMKRSHLSNFDLPLSPLAAIHSRYRSVSVTVLLDMNVIGIADTAFRIVYSVSPRLLRIARASLPLRRIIVLEFWRYLVLSRMGLNFFKRINKTPIENTRFRERKIRDVLYKGALGEQINVLAYASVSRKRGKLSNRGRSGSVSN